MHRDTILHEGKCKHSFVDMTIMLYLKPSLSSLVSLMIANDFASNVAKRKYQMTGSCVASLTVGQALCVNRSHAFLPYCIAPHHTALHDAASYVNLPLVQMHTQQLRIKFQFSLS